MKRGMTFLFAACACCIASAAGAEAIAIYNTAGGGSVAVGTLDVSRDFDSTWGLDKVVFKLGSWSLPSFADAEINVLVGKWSVSPSATSASTVGACLNGSDTTWKALSRLGYNEEEGYYYNRSAPYSFMNFTNEIPGTSQFAWTRTPSAASPVAGKMFGDFYGGWSEVGSDYFVGVGDTLATLYVTPNADVTFTAAGDPDCIGTTKGSLMHCSFTTQIPEPSTLALLAGGLVGLAAFAWRKRS